MKKIKKVKENENKIKEYLIELEKLEIRDDSSIKNVIMGIEGKVSVLYWDSISMLLPESVNFKNRNQKPENDVVNAMLNYGYAILASQITKSILLHGLDAYCGFLHADRYKRTSLTYDLIEEFRQQIVDKTVIKLINYKQIDEDSIDHRNNALNLESRKILAAAIMDKLHSEISYGDEKVSYLEIIDNQCSVLVDTLIGDGEYEGFYLQW
ncbi:CRISPR-associated endonuclease Cas1 [Methanobrevibacter woesei]|uniref:CRISPR-associated endonuclease Cas1 n=1 Tax=Methanobrevibacter woesei TaxID=190976 RepID=UPI003182C87C